MQNYLLYNASEGIHTTNECRYALLKLLSVYNLKLPQNLSVVVHTEHPRLFDDFHTFFPQFEVKGPVKNMHNDKAQLIQNFFSTTEGNLLFCDTATYPVMPIETLFRHIEEGMLILYKKVKPPTNGRANISRQVQYLLSGAQHKMDGLPRKVEDIQVFNTAVTGLNHAGLSAVKFAGEMTNRVFKQISHPFAVNFAFSYAFQKQLPIKTANDYFADYFELSEFRTLLQTFFSKNEEESIPSLVKLVSYLDVDSIQKDKAMHNRQPLWQKWWNKLSGRGWSIRKYEKRIS